MLRILLLLRSLSTFLLRPRYTVQIHKIRSIKVQMTTPAAARTTVGFFQMKSGNRIRLAARCFTFSTFSFSVLPDPLSCHQQPVCVDAVRRTGNKRYKIFSG